MPVYPTPLNPLPDYWTIYGHSYLQTAFGTLFTSGRMDAVFRGRLDVECSSWVGRAVDGACIAKEGRSTGGYAKVYQEMTTIRQGAPYVSDTGAHLLCWGINDLGQVGSTTQTRAGWKHSLRSVISRCRAAAVFEDTSASVSYGAGFVSTGSVSDFASGSSVRSATSTTNANLTITIPADYNGETIAISWVASPGAFAGTVTYSGTAGLTGTLSTSSQAAFSGSHGPAITRYVAPVTGATQTIIATVTQLDAGGTVSFDCWWLESHVPPVVIVCNISRLTAAGYALYGGWAGTEAAKDADVVAWNSDLAAVVAEFDAMVQIADIDSAINKSAVLYGSDGLHPNELGSAKCADACATALLQCRATTSFGLAAHFNPGNRRGGYITANHLSGQWYTSDFRLVGAAYTTVSGDQFSIPFVVTAGRERWIQLGVEVVTSTVSTTIRWGVYDDRGSDSGVGYPQNLLIELTSAGAFTLTTGAGSKVSPLSPTAGNINNPFDPGLYWLVLKVCTVGTTTLRTISGPCPQLPNLSAGVVLNTTGGPMGYKLTGQGTTALPTTHAAGGVLTDPVPFVGVKMN